MWRRLRWSSGRPLRLSTPPLHAPPYPYKYWDVIAQQVTIPDHHQTFYWCKVFKAPILETKHHIIGVSPLVDKENVMRGAVLYECLGGRRELEQQTLHRGTECHSVPPLWRACAAPVAIWRTGSQGEMYPEHVGLPLVEGEGKSTYFMLEVHYENTKMIRVLDSSGLRIYYTSELRQYDGGIFLNGITATPTHIIPPDQQSFTSNALCDNQCTNLMLPENGIKVVSVGFHSHSAGRKMRLRHIRRDQELPPIAEDGKYDAEFQDGIKLMDEVEVMPGDDLITECTYNTTDKSHLIVGGFTSRNERCGSYLVYYPRMALSGCYSMTPADFFFQAFGVKEFYNYHIEEIEKMILADSHKQLKKEVRPSLQGLVFQFSEKEGFNLDMSKSTMSLSVRHDSLFTWLMIYKPPEFQNRSFLSHLQQLPWSEQIFTKRVEETINYGKYKTFCRLQDYSLAMPSMVYNLPSFTPYSKNSSGGNCAAYSAGDSNSGTPAVIMSWLLPVLLALASFSG